MEPRKSKSSRWTELPKDYVSQVVKALKESFKDEVKSGKFLVEGRIYPDELLIRMGFLESGRLRQTNFEISLDYKAGKEDTLKLLNLAMDVGATMLEELFSSPDDHDFPRIWQPFEVEGRTLFMQFSSLNSALEKQASELLGESTERLVHESEDSEDERTMEIVKEKLGLDDDDDEITEVMDDDGEKNPRRRRH